MKAETKDKYLAYALHRDSVEAPLQGDRWRDIKPLLKKMEAEGHIQLYDWRKTSARYGITPDGSAFYYKGGYKKEEDRLFWKDRMVEMFSGLLDLFGR